MEQVSPCIRGFYFKTLWFEAVDEEYLGFLDQRKRVKMQRLPEPNQSNVDNLNNVRREASRHFKIKKKDYLKAKFEEFIRHSKQQKCFEANFDVLLTVYLSIILVINQLNTQNIFLQ